MWGQDGARVILGRVASHPILVMVSLDCYKSSSSSVREESKLLLISSYYLMSLWGGQPRED